MQLHDIINKSIRYNDASCFDICKLIFGWKSNRIINAVADHCRNHIQNSCLAQRSLYQREYFIHDAKNRSQPGFFCLLHHKLDHSSLSLGTSHIQTCGITDTAVGNCLHTVQMILADDCLDIIWPLGELDRRISHSCLL